MKKLAISLLLVSGVIVAGCQTAQEALTESGGIKMTKEEVIAVTSDYTGEWLSGEGDSYHAPDGTYLYKEKTGKTGAGKWSVTDNGTFCVQVKEWWGDETHCNWEHFKKGNNRHVYNIEKAKMYKVDLKTISKGNNL